MKIKASSLFYAIMVSLLIGLLCTLVILQKYYHFVEIASYHRQIALIDNCKSGMNLLKYTTQYRNNGSKVIDLYGAEEDSVKLTQRDWGCFSVFCSQAFRRGDTLSLINLMGANISQQNNYSLYLPDHNRPLSLCGKTKIEGTVFIPESGVKRAYIEGRSYVGSQLIYGSIKKSESKLPKLNSQWLAQLEDLLHFSSLSEYDQISFSSLETDLKNDFADRTKVLYASDSISISNLSLNGNIVVISTTAIFVKRSAHLENIILVAPRIYLDRSVNFQGQLLASKTILIDENSTLEFPSAVLGIGDSLNIHISSNAEINGSILLTGDQNDLLAIDADAIVVGQVYNSGVTQLRGTILGNLTTNKFYLKTPSSVYENHILGGAITNNNFPMEYFGLYWANKNIDWIDLVDLR